MTPPTTPALDAVESLRRAIEHRVAYNRECGYSDVRHGQIVLSIREGDAILEALNDATKLRAVVQDAFGTADPELLDGLPALDDAKLIDWMERARRGVTPVIADDHMGEPTRLLWVVDDAMQNCYMPTIREAIERTIETDDRPAVFGDLVA